MVIIFESQARTKMLIKKNILRLVLFSSLLLSYFDGILVPVALLYQINHFFGRLVLLLPVKGQVCVRLHPQDLDEVGHFRRLKIGRRSQARERERSFKLTYLPTTNLLKIKFTFRRSFQTQQLLLTKGCDRETVRTGIRARSGILALTDTI